MLRAFLVRHRLTPGGLLTALLTIILSIYLIYAYSENKCNVVSILLVRSAHSPPPPPPPSSVAVPPLPRDSGLARVYIATNSLTLSLMLAFLISLSLQPLLRTAAKHLSSVNGTSGYWLDYGSLLGAWRDGGIIPWCVSVAHGGVRHVEESAGK